MLHILITGITGYLGSTLAKNLIEKDYHVYGLKRKKSTIDRLKLIKKNLILFDIENGIEKLFASHYFDIVIHTATCYGLNNETNIELIDANVNLPLELLKFSKKYNVQTFINTDTITPQNLNNYAISKDYFLNAAKNLIDYNIIFINLKLEYFYDIYSNVDRFMPWLILKCMSNEKDVFIKNPLQKRDFIHLSDVISAFIILIEKKHCLALGFNNFEAGCGSQITIEQLTLKTRIITKSTSTFNYNSKMNEDLYPLINNSDLILLNWKPKIALHDGIVELFQHYSNENCKLI